MQSNIWFPCKSVRCARVISGFANHFPSDCVFCIFVTLRLITFFTVKLMYCSLHSAKHKDFICHVLCSTYWRKAAAAKVALVWVFLTSVAK